MIYFIHVAKTSGTFIQNYFYRIFGVKRYGKNSKFKVVKNIKNLDGYIFTFIRNPWEWQVSSYFHLRQSWQCRDRKGFIKNYPTFDDYMKIVGGTEKEFLTKYRADNQYFTQLFNTIINMNKINFIGKMEQLYDDINIVLKDNEINSVISPKKFYDEIYLEESQISHDKFNRKNMSKIGSTIHDHYSTYYTDETIKQIYDNNKEIIDNYGYEFEYK